MEVLTQPLGIGALMEGIEKRLSALEAEIARLTELTNWQKEVIFSLTRSGVQMRTVIYSLVRIAEKTPLLLAYDEEFSGQYLKAVSSQFGLKENPSALNEERQAIALRAGLSLPGD